MPDEAPSQMEARLLNSTAVYLKWKPPPPQTLNGELQGYRIEVRSNNTDTKTDIVTVGTAPTLLLGNLTSGVSYSVRVAATTRAGVGPFSLPAVLRLDPVTQVVDSHQQRPIGTDMRNGDFITETWFMALLISMVTVMVLLFAAMLLVRRRQMLAKKTMTPSRTNGPVLNTPLKHEAPLWLDKEALHDYSSTLPEYSKLNPQEYSRVDYNSMNGHVHQNGVNLMQNPLEFTRSDRLENGYVMKLGGKYQDYSSMQVRDYASPSLGDRNSQVVDYAEVDASVVAVQDGSTSPAPYATTTLVTGTRRTGSCLVRIPYASNFNVQDLSLC